MSITTNLKSKKAMNNTIKDSDIREALRRMYSHIPSLSPDFKERILNIFFLLVYISIHTFFGGPYRQGSQKLLALVCSHHHARHL